jgi:hypothetical protein
MTSTDEILSWLNYETPSRISKFSQFSFNIINSPDIPDASKDQEITELVSRLEIAKENLELYEVQVCCADRLRESNSKKALDLLIKAQKGYQREQDKHREAIVVWLLSIVRTKRRENLDAYADALRARQILEDIKKSQIKQRYQSSQELESSYQLDRKDERISWYLDKINRITIDLTATPEEGFTWINQFEGSHFSAASLKLVDQIKTEMKNNRTGQANYFLLDLLDQVHASEDYFETAEAFAFAGYQKYQIGELEEAEVLLKSAIAQYPPDSHQRAAVRWILGMILFSNTKKSRDAVLLCKKCMEEMEEAKEKVERLNKKSRVDWYNQRLNLMRIVFKQKVEISITQSGLEII